MVHARPAAERETVGQPRRTGVSFDCMSSPATTKDRIIEVLRGLPPNATVDDAIERLVFMARVEEGLAQLDAGEGIPHEEVKRRFGA
jgi:hypothetical protein